MKRVCGPFTSVLLVVALLAAGCSSSPKSSAAARQATGAARTGTDRGSNREREGEGHQGGGRTLKKAVHHDTSLPLRTIKPVVDTSTGGEGGGQDSR